MCRFIHLKTLNFKRRLYFCCQRQKIADTDEKKREKKINSNFMYFFIPIQLTLTTFIENQFSQSSVTCLSKILYYPKSFLKITSLSRKMQYIILII